MKEEISNGFLIMLFEYDIECIDNKPDQKSMS